MIYNQRGDGDLEQATISTALGPQRSMGFTFTLVNAFGKPGPWWECQWICGPWGGAIQAQDWEFVLAWARKQGADKAFIQDPDTGEWAALAL
ncbi:hypothetical protein [Actinopolymorpha pittospori]|uniref:Uncharacterized protein n=1 Tax=Actinopolymorpha pittospori TaxID=648752 RepID=A0A927MN45_9ACTN|nr:hypothetical protein [Actinopolymorpha pittospori]MBE1603296.1 hypothetical protein [Actinopolymorpha pittospori]